MKKIIALLITLAAALGCVGIVLSMAAANDENSEFTLSMQINNPNMSINGEELSIDGNGTTPVIVNGRTLVPIRAIIEAMGGTVDWDGAAQAVELNYNEDKIELVIDSTDAYLNGELNTLDTAPSIINERTMLPIRFIAESFRFDVAWDESAQTITITKSANDTTAASNSNILVAYFTAAENFDNTVDAVSAATGYAGSDGEAGYIAKQIAKNTGAALFSIQTEEKYPVGYNELAALARAQQDSGELPKLSTHIDNLDQYDTVFVVHPVWWYDIPQVMYSFFDEYDFSGKTIIPVTTHAGSSSTGPSSIEKIEPNASVRTDLHLAIRSGTSEETINATVDAWLNDRVEFEKK